MTKTCKNLVCIWLLAIGLNIQQSIKAQVYTANFDNDVNGWTFSTQQGGNDWKRHAGEGLNGTAGLRNKNVSTPNWAISPGITLSGGVEYRVSFYARAANTNSRTITFAYNTTASRTGATVVATTGNNPTQFTLYQYTFSVPSTGNYHLVFWGNQVANTWVFQYLDEVSIELLNTPPTISLTAPANNATFILGTAINLTADAADADGLVSQVEFFANGQSVGIDNSAPYSVSWNPVSAGSYTLTAMATDNQGATTTSAARSVNIVANQPPTVSILAPTGGSTYFRNQTVNISASAADSDGNVALIEFFIDGNKVGEDDSAPYTIDWEATGLGSKSLTARATDNLGAQTTSAAVSITINNQNPSVSITMPGNGGSFVQGETITFQSVATDADGNVVKVEYFANGNKIGEASQAPYTFVWVGAAQGSYNVTALATDNDGGTANSSSISISVGAFAPQVLIDQNFNDNANGWVFSTAAGGNDWRRYADQGVNGSGGLRNKFSNSNNQNWAIAPVVSLNGGTTYAFSVDARLAKGTTTRDIQFLYNTSPSLVGATAFYTQRLPNDSYNNPPFVKYVGQFTAPTSGSYYLIIRCLGPGYIFMYVDNVLLEKNFAPTVSITSPSNNAQFNEGTSVTFEVDAQDLDGNITKVEYFANGNKIGESTTAPFSFTWNHAQIWPGNYSVVARAHDNRFNTTNSAQSSFIMNFADGTLDTYVNYNFNANLGDWKFVNTTADGQAIRHRPSGGYQNSGFLQLFNVNLTSFAYSPGIYLKQGVNYKFQFRNDVSTSNRQFKWQVNTSPELGGQTIMTFTPATSDDYLIVRETTFTVPADGIYYFTISNNSTGGYQQLGLDNVRIIGDLNQCPIATITSPSKDIVTAEGANVGLTASAVDYDGSITKVEFFANGTKLGESTEAPYTFLWTNVQIGTYLVTAVPTDNLGVSLASASRTVTVSNAGFSAISFLGGETAGDAVRGAVIQHNGTVVLAANISNATPGNVQPILLNGADATTSGALIRLNAEGTEVLSVTRLANHVNDLAQDSIGNLYVACGSQGLLKLNAEATQVLWSKTFGSANAHRVDAGPAGYSVVLTSGFSNYDSYNITGATIYTYAPDGNQLSSFGAVNQYCSDVAIHEPSQTVFTIGFKNVVTPTYDAGNQPVFIPDFRGRAYDGTIKFTGYNWDSDSASPNWLNRPQSNMADTKAAKVSIGKDGKLYIAYEVAGGNHPLRYDPFNIMQPVTIVGGDSYHNFANTGSEHKLVVCRYEPATGAFLLGQAFCGRLPNGAGNAVGVGLGNVDADQTGRVYVTGKAASGLPLTVDHLPGSYDGGAFLLILSPNMATREYVGRLSSTGGGRALYVKNANHWVTGGTTSGNLYATNPLQENMASDNTGHFGVWYQNGGNARRAYAAEQITTSAEAGISIYPNPVDSRKMLNIKLPESNTPVQLRISDLSGKIVQMQELTDNVNTLSLQGITKGIYIIRLSSNAFNYTSKIVVD